MFRDENSMAELELLYAEAIRKKLKGTVYSNSKGEGSWVVSNDKMVESDQGQKKQPSPCTAHTFNTHEEAD
jgi:hypothetical protein